MDFVCVWWLDYSFGMRQLGEKRKKRKAGIHQKATCAKWLETARVAVEEATTGPDT